MKRFYSSRDLAELLSVNESTVKRWSDIGYINCVRTKGGHRRFPIQSVIRFVQESKMEVPELAAQMFSSRDLQANLVAGNTDVLAPRLKEAALAGDLAESLSILRAGLAAKPNLLSLYSDVVFSPLVEIGEEWAAGKLSVDAEHLASQTIRDAVVRLQSSVHGKPSIGLTAVLACYEGELHDIVLHCVASYLQAQGWTVLNLGQSTPVDSLINAIKKRKPQLVVVSARVLEHERRYLRAINQKIFPAAHRLGARVAVGGPEMKSRFGDRLRTDFVSHSILDLETIADLRNYHK